ncbi:MAG: GTPase [Planctomycetota bacterium]
MTQRNGKRVVILGAAGRDFHLFNMVYRDHPEDVVLAFTAAQIPDIDDRRYPPELAGPHYPAGIPIHPESELDRLIRAEAVDEVVFAYSDVPHTTVMHLASRAVAAGADFRLLATAHTLLRAPCPVVSICAVRTGAGKSPVARAVAATLRAAGRRVGVIRHPMPYGDLARQAVQRFATLEELDAADCTIEEREEYEPHIAQGAVMWAGVDYGRIVEAAAAESDVLLWDGGNNDTAFIASDLEIVLLDPHRAGHERDYFPGEVNLLRADVLLTTKVDSAERAAVDAVQAAARAVNPRAAHFEAALPITVDEPALITGKRVLVVEDGPTLTHGGMAWGAGVLAARAVGAELVDPRPHAVGSIADTFAAWPHIGACLPAMGYSATQVEELSATIAAVPCDAVLVATPVDLRRLLALERPAARAQYTAELQGGASWRELLAPIVAQLEQRHG